MSTYTLYSDTARDTALDAIGGEMMGTQDTELLKQIFVAAGASAAITSGYLAVVDGKLHISGLPTSNPGAGILWNNGGTIAIGT